MSRIGGAAAAAATKAPSLASSTNNKRQAYAAVATSTSHFTMDDDEEDENGRRDDDDDDDAMNDSTNNGLQDDEEGARFRRNRRRLGAANAPSSATAIASSSVWSSRVGGNLRLALAVLLGVVIGLVLRRHPAAPLSPPMAPLDPNAGTTTTTTRQYSVTYDPTVAALPWNPLDLQGSDMLRPDILSPLPFPSSENIAQTKEPTTNQQRDKDEPGLGYIMQPDIVNGTAVFVSDGNLFWTQWSSPKATSTVPSSSSSSLAAIRLTTTIGNVRTPRINPRYPHLIAFTATYQNRRDVYLLDLRGSSSSSISGRHQQHPVQRLTYVDSASGVNGVAGWSADGTKLLYSATAMAVGLRDLRLYEISLVQQQPPTTSTNSNPNNHTVWAGLETRPIPLAQATEGVVHADGEDDCLFFVRHKQGSHTARYVGGTTEQLWAYCDGEDRAVALTSDYIGTSKQPRILKLLDETDGSSKSFLLFLSDRTPMDADKPIGPALFYSKTWRATSMNLWAAPLPTAKELYPHSGSSQALDASLSFALSPMIQLTRVSCHFEGMALQEFAVDEVTGHVLLRIGADLYSLPALAVRDGLLQPSTEFTAIPVPFPVQVVSDFHNQLERHIKVDVKEHLTMVDVFDVFGPMFEVSTLTLLTLRGQVWVTPVLQSQGDALFPGSGQYVPPRRYRVVPGAMTGGAIRVLAAKNVPLYPPDTWPEWGVGMTQPLPASSRRLALILATDPLSPTAEQGFYMIEIQPDSVNSFTDLRRLPNPFVGGNVNGGGTAAGGLGSVLERSVVVSPCGRRMAWADTDNRICLMSLPLFVNQTTTKNATTSSFQCLPRSNDMGEPLAGTIATLTWSPGGRYLAVEHNALNQFGVISIVDCGDPEPSVDKPTTVTDILIGQISQVTSSRFNSIGAYWGTSKSGTRMPAENLGQPISEELTSLYFLSDRDVVSDVMHPWGSRLPMPHFRSMDGYVYALPLPHKGPPQTLNMTGNYSLVSPFHKDADLELPRGDLSFAWKAYRMVGVPKGRYVDIVSLSSNSGCITLIDQDDDYLYRALFFCSSLTSSASIVPGLSRWGVSTSREHLYFVASIDGKITVVGNSASGVAGFVSDAGGKQMQVYTSNMALSVWPALEYRQMYADGWRLMRDYFYDANMHNVDWKSIFFRYQHLVKRCGKREELDDVLGQMASETSALHSFVYGGEYNSPLQPPLFPASLGVTMTRSPHWKGFMITEIPLRDPDFDVLDGIPQYCPISDQALRPTGQVGLQVGDVIVSVNGESVMLVPDINMMIRGTAGESIRLGVLRLQSRIQPDPMTATATPESLIVVPISSLGADTLRYNAWEWKTRQMAKEMASKAGFSVGYIHMRAMDRNGEDAFARGYFPDHDKDALIIDVRHNDGGNIDSWILSVLQRQAWMYWSSRSGDKRYGELDWDEQFAFRGQLVVLVDERTSSNGEGLARGISELGLGTIIGTRTWGGGIWGSSSNTLVDGGIAAAPQFGIFNDKFGWGGGVEMIGVSPDINVDNDPRMTFSGRDSQLERAIAELKSLLKKEPVPPFQTPDGERPDMSLHFDACPA